MVGRLPAATGIEGRPVQDDARLGVGRIGPDHCAFPVAHGGIGKIEALRPTVMCNTHGREPSC
jgi:hypothetical protein